MVYTFQIIHLYIIDNQIFNKIMVYIIYVKKSMADSKTTT